MRERLFLTVRGHFCTDEVYEQPRRALGVGVVQGLLEEILMARAPRAYRAPIVVTLATALLPSCGSGSADDGLGGAGGTETGGASSSGGKTATGGRSSGGAGGASGGSSSGGRATGGLGGDQTGTGGDSPVPACPDDYLFPQLTCPPTARCEMASECTSGESRVFSFTCTEDGDRWVFKGGDCENSYEYCEAIGNTLCVDDTWLYQGQGGNPPGPCPEELPAEGSLCDAGDGFGADRDACGYPCGDAWTVIGCVASTDDIYGEGEWESDGACSGGGADGG